MNSKQLYLRLLTYVKPYWKGFALSIITMIILATLQPLFPALLKPLMDEAFVAKNAESIRTMPLLFVLLFFVRGIATFASDVSITWVSSHLIMDIRRDMFDKILQLPRSYFDAHASGKLISKVTFNVSQVTTACTNALIVIIRDTLSIIFLLGLMFYLDWKLSLIVFVLVPVAAITIRMIAGRLRKLSRRLQDNIGDMTHTLDEAITGNKVVRIFGGEEYETRRFAHINNWVRRNTMKMKTAAALNAPTVEFIAAIALAIIVYVAAVKSAQNQITAGDFVAFFTAMAMLFAPAKRITGINEQLQRALAAAETVFDLTDQPKEKDEGTKTLDPVKGHLVLNQVRFSYPGADQAALKGISLDIQPGETIALVGQSGSGKSTIVNLIPRFYENYEGSITLDDIDIHELTLKNLRDHIALVSQEVVLFDDTIAANIAYGTKSNASEEEIIHAAKAAHAWEFIENLPDGLQAPVGENGSRLSGGQRQRIAIARAFLKDAPVLLFDEATSALDTESEHYVQDAMEQLRKDRTTIVIAHRLSTIQNADRIVVMQDGEIVECGQHAELLARKGLYHKLYNMQFSDNPANS